MNANLLFVDLSSNNLLPTKRQLLRHYRWQRKNWPNRRPLLVVKVTQGETYVWKDGAKLAAWWHSFGADAVVGHYHFLMGSQEASGARQAVWFWAHVRPTLRDGDVLIEDVETVGDIPAEHVDFQNRLAGLVVVTKLVVERWTYGSADFLDAHATKRAGTWLWLAGYPTYPKIPSAWSIKTLAAHQYSDAGKAVGIPGKVDMSNLLEPGSVPTLPPPTYPAKGFTKINGAIIRRATRILSKRGAGHSPLSPNAKKATAALVAAAEKAEKV